ncbi:ABC transporter permease [Parasphaerochaeta coccoides]|uniref:Inner-membrane translocator n=1 Tax=Parasphaerochaeta coccoides (strain ATCC BAA-1237 / DSM 17374 / SPN1) TaxID=760011 RepID=F4GKD5_PARC1|nr:ABC transporter permease [Parasphaerochaeta coccoides]AEC02331.1 inner-membrane translocator [Parasphaerochaeta coccoides DSM 17374]
MKNRLSGKTLSVSRRLMDSQGFTSLMVVLLGFLVGTILVALVGRNPLNLYKAILQALTGYNVDNGRMNVRYIGETLNYSVPFILCGFSLAFAARTGLFNIGGEGQYIMGMTVAQVIALLGPQVPFLHAALAIVCATLIGALWGGVVGLLKARYEVSEVVSTIMLNYIALYLSRIICLQLPGATTFRTANFPTTAVIDNSFLQRLTNNSLLNSGFFLMIIAVVLYWFIMEKTSLGFGLRATGFNKEAARNSGIPVVKSIALSMAFAGAFAGLAGGIVALGSFKYGRVISGMDNYGFNGIAVALVGNNTAIGTMLAGFLFGMLKNAQALMQGKQIPKEITFIIQGLIVVFISLRSALDLYRQWNDKKRLQKEVLAK